MRLESVVAKSQWVMITRAGVLAEDDMGMAQGPFDTVTPMKGASGLVFFALKTDLGFRETDTFGTGE